MIVNRVRPRLLTDDQVGANGKVDVKALTAALAEFDVDAAHAPAFAKEMADYAVRQQIQEENLARLDEVDLPRIVLPDLNPPVDLGELKDLAACFVGAAQ